MDDQVLGLLRFGMLGLLYLFFARVMWAVWSEVRTVVQTRARSLVVLEPPSARRTLTPTTGSLVVGRSPDCDLALADDAYLSQRHLGVTADASGLWVEDLGSTNGTLLDGRRITTREPLYQGNRVSAGTLVMEAR